MVRSSLVLDNHILVKHLRIGLEEFAAVTCDGINDTRPTLHESIHWACYGHC